MQLSVSKLIPIRGVMTTAIITVLLSLINIGSSTAFTNVTSLTVSGLYSSYLVALSLLLYHRSIGSIKPCGFYPSDAPVNSLGRDLTWGPWKIPGVLGIFINTYACLYMIVILFFSFWPPQRSITAENMNYSSLVLGSVVLFASVYYLIRGHREYTGPLIEETGRGLRP